MEDIDLKAIATKARDAANKAIAKAVQAELDAEPKVDGFLSTLRKNKHTGLIVFIALFAISAGSFVLGINGCHI